MIDYKSKIMKRSFLTLLLIAGVAMVSAQTLPIKVGVFLPFKTQGGMQQRYVEYYRGLLMAADSIGRELPGAKFDITAADCGSTAADMKALLDESKNGVFDIIFAPSNQAQIEVANEYSKLNGTKLAVPFGCAYDNFIKNVNFYALKVTQTDYTVQAYKLVKKVFPTKKLYVVATNADDGICPFANYVSKYAKGAKYVGYDGTNKKVAQLLGDEDAVIIPIRYDEQTRNDLISLAAQVGKVKAAVIGYPAWYESATNEAQRATLSSLNAYVLQPYYPLYGEARARSLAREYKENFDSELPWENFSVPMWGFDTAYYLLKGRVKFGTEFYDQRPWMAPMQSEFYFEPRAELEGLINTQIMLIHYGQGDKMQLMSLPVEDKK